MLDRLFSPLQCKFGFKMLCHLTLPRAEETVGITEILLDQITITRV